ncbi:MAG: S-layer homology domain-containing protein [Solibacillus sp.]
MKKWNYLLLAGALLVMPIEAQASQKFSDVPSNHYAIEAIQWAEKKGITSGDNGKFNPSKKVTEAQFVKMYAEFFEHQLLITSDNDLSIWSKIYYDGLAQYGVPLKGATNTAVRNQPITRGEVAQLIAFAHGKSSDLESAVRYMMETGISTGQNKEATTILAAYGASNTLTRAQAVAFLYRVNSIFGNKLVSKHIGEVDISEEISIPTELEKSEPSEPKDLTEDKKVTATPITVIEKQPEHLISTKAPQEENESAEILTQFITVPQHTYDTVEVEKVMTRISRIPEPYLRELVKNGVELRLINTLLTDQPEYEHLKGVTPRGWEHTGKTWDDVPGIGGNPIIVRIGQSDFNSGHGTLNLELHETAHVIDSYLFKSVSQSAEFQDIMHKELDNLIKDHPNQYNKVYFTYPEEYFAESFVYFYLNDTRHEELQQKAPLTYQFFLELEKEYVN